jgi:hypothetical protein
MTRCYKLNRVSGEQAKIAGGNTARVYKFDVARLTAPREEPTSLRGDKAISDRTADPHYNHRIRRPASSSISLTQALVTDRGSAVVPSGE